MAHIIYYLTHDDAKKLGISNFYLNSVENSFSDFINEEVLNIYITKQFLNEYGELIKAGYQLTGFTDYNLYCDFINDDKLIEEFKDMCNIKKNFKTINENKNLLLNKSFFDLIKIFLKKNTKYYKKLKNINFKGIYAEGEYYFDSLKDFKKYSGISISGFSIVDIFITYGNNKAMILKGDFKNLDTIEMNNILNDYNKIILQNKNDEIIYDYNYTFLGLFDEYLENEDKFNKTYKDIKYLGFITRNDKRDYYNINRNKIINFYKKIGLSDNIINFITKSELNFNLFEAIVMIDDKNLNVFLNEYVNKDNFYQLIVLNAFILYIDNTNILDIIFIISIFNYFKYKNELKYTLNYVFYIDKSLYTLFNNNIELQRSFVKLKNGYYIHRYKNNSSIIKAYPKYCDNIFKFNENPYIEKNIKIFININKKYIFRKFYEEG